MAGYIVVDIQITKPDEFQKYIQQAGPTSAPYGGRLIANAGRPVTLEGDWKPRGRILIMEFPSVEQAKAWYQSPEYAAAIPLRQRTSVSSFILVEGA